MAWARVIRGTSYQCQAGNFLVGQGLGKLRVGQRIGHADNDLALLEFVQILAAVTGIAAGRLHLQYYLGGSENLIAINQLGSGSFESAVRVAGNITGATLDDDLDTLFFKQCADIGRR